MAFLLGVLLVLIPGLGLAQQPGKTVPEQLADCSALLRVKTELPCRCDQVEHLSAQLLLRAEKAEAALKDAENQVKLLQAQRPDGQKDDK